MPRYKSRWWDKAKAGSFEEISIESLIANCKSESDMLTTVLLYYTGARPTELCLAKWGDLEIDEKESLFKLFLVTLKNGVNRIVWFPINDYTRFLIEEKAKHDPNELILGGRNRHYIKQLIWRLSNKTLTAYFLRHNLYSKLAVKGVPAVILKEHKGAKTLKSVEDYLHVNREEVKKLAYSIE
ncbi:MAG: tyrosine-type recombinase/integrase [Candidatus Aenigmatarchaeota archaeon]